MAIYAIDFDNTLAITRFPEIIAPNKKMVAFAKAVKAQGHQIILWTSRAGADLENAVEWCRLQGIVFDAVNEPLPEQIKRWGNDTRKIYADYYIDDKNMTIAQVESTMNQIKEIMEISIHAPTRGATLKDVLLQLRDKFQSTLPQGERHRPVF